MSAERFYTIAACAVVAVGLILAFAYLGSPSHARAVALDRLRTRDLETIASRLDRHGSLPSRLPENLAETDPTTHQAYSYKRVDARHYQLCATFETASVKRIENVPDVGPGYATYQYVPRNWSHPGGYHCFSLDI
ncbi:MAG: hypothetical protein WBD74_03240 [Candidatus Aquilonibacter sp.]